MAASLVANYALGRSWEWQENSPQFRCCCRCCHVRIGATAIGVLGFIYALFQFVQTVTLFTRMGPAHTLSLAVVMIGVLLGVVAILLLFVGIFTSRPLLLVPHLVMQSLSVVVLFAMTSLCLFGLLTGSAILLRIINATDDEQDRPWNAFGAPSNKPDTYVVSEALTYILLVSMFVFLFGMVLELWLLLVVYWCFKYLQLKSAYVKNAETLYSATDSNDFPMAEYDSRKSAHGHLD